jgi:hypothetical protein
MRQRTTARSRHLALLSVMMAATSLFGGATQVPVHAATPGFLILTPDPIVPTVDAPIVVVAVNALGQVKTGYRGTVRFSTNATGVSALPGSYTFHGYSEGGIHVFQDGLDVASPQSGVTVTVTDQAVPSLTATSATFDVVTRPAVPRFVQARTAVGSGATPSVTLRTAPTPGDLELAFISSNQGVPSLSGWTSIRTGANLAAFYRIVPDGASATVTADPFAGPTHWTFNVNEYRGVFAAHPIAGAGTVGDRGSTTGIGSANVAIHPPGIASELGGSDVRLVVALYERNGSSPGHDGRPVQAHVTSDLFRGDAEGACTSSELGWGRGWHVRSRHTAPPATTDNLLTVSDQGVTCPIPGFTSVRTGWNWPDATTRAVLPDRSTATIILALRGTS